MFKKFFSLVLITIFSLSTLSVHADKVEERQWKDEIIYSLLIDRFNNGKNDNDFEVNTKDPLSYHGGDFQGIIDKLDYLKEMGFTAIQLSPIFANEEKGYHGEWVNDFYEIEEHFGTIAEFKQLVQAAHQRDLKILLEFPVNHIGKNHPWISDPSKQSWFHDHKELTNKSNQLEGKQAWIDGLPSLALENPEVKKYLIDAAKWWVEETNIDGFGFINVDYVPHDFWQELVIEVKETKENLFLFGSISEADFEQLNLFQEIGFTGLTDLPLNVPLRSIFAKTDLSMKPLFDVWEKNKTFYEHPEAMIAFFDHKNIERFTRDMANENEFPGARWKMALAYLYTQPEIPAIYYGTEIAINGGLPPENQQLMDFRTDKELIDYMTKLGKLRQEHQALTRGSMELLYENNGMAVFKRQYEHETIVVAINNTTTDQTATISADQLADDKELRGLLGTDLVRSDNGEYQIVIERENAEIYHLLDRSGYNILFILSIFGVFSAFIVFMYVVWKRGKNINPYKE